RDRRDVRSTVLAPRCLARSTAARVNASPTPRPRAISSTTTSSIQARIADGMRKTTRVRVPMMRLPALGSRARSTVLCGAPMISASDSRVSRAADEDSWGRSRPNASTTSAVAASAITTSTGLFGFAIRAQDLRQRNVVVPADALQNQEDGRTLAAVGDEMRPALAHRVRLAGPEAHFLLRIAQEQAHVALQDVERVLDLAVVVPGHLLARSDLQLRDSKARALGMPGPALDLVEMTRVPHAFAFDGFHGAPPLRRDGTIGGDTVTSGGSRQWARICWKSSRMESPCSR